MLQRSASLLPEPPPLPRLLASGPVAVFLDFDGTIVEIAERPEAIAVPPGLASRLERLAGRLGGALAVVSGRSVGDLQRFLGREMLHFAGSHGADVRTPSGEPLSAARPVPVQVLEQLGAYAAASGLHLETKPHGAALHYRARPERGEEACGMVRALAAAQGLAAKTGKCVVELVWPGADKGTAVELLAARAPFAGARPVFIGDDVTDEDGFAAARRLGGFGIAVGPRPSAGASFALTGVKEVHAWMDA